MRKYILPLIILSLFLTACSQENEVLEVEEEKINEMIQEEGVAEVEEIEEEKEIEVEKTKVSFEVKESVDYDNCIMDKESFLKFKENINNNYKKSELSFTYNLLLYENFCDFTNLENGKYIKNLDYSILNINKLEDYIYIKNSGFGYPMIYEYIINNDGTFYTNNVFLTKKIELNEIKNIIKDADYEKLKLLIDIGFNINNIIKFKEEREKYKIIQKGIYNIIGHYDKEFLIFEYKSNDVSIILSIDTKILNKKKGLSKIFKPNPYEVCHEPCFHEILKVNLESFLQENKIELNKKIDFNDIFESIFQEELRYKYESGYSSYIKNKNLFKLQKNTENIKIEFVDLGLPLDDKLYGIRFYEGEKFLENVILFKE